ncbi:MAG: magnesium/cobalt transporter CorA [Gammaproteobacteria bacterium]|nr:magnesium/cobalt transporter CorA [Gammaproteobacteria bacterium]
MSRVMKKRSRKAGMPPGTLIYLGDDKSTATRITLLHYAGQQVVEKEIQTAEECQVFLDTPGVCWISVTGVHEVEKLAPFGKVFNLHPLVLEDVLNTDQRPKLEDYGEYIYIVLRQLKNSSPSNGIVTEQISLVLGRNFVISFLESESEIFKPVKERILQTRGRICNQGADYLAYALMDMVVDNYFSIFENLGERIEELEELLISKPAPEQMRNLHALKRELLSLRKSVWPLREVLSALQRGESTLIQKETGLYLRDVYDHTIQVIDTLETYRDMLSGMLDIYLSSLSNRLNQVMKVLTVVSTIFMPLTFIAGVYGMNFHNMPELGWRWGYPTVLLLMAAIAAGMLIFFRRKKWI